jgi:protein-L-isoaspartate(D-aspartate) O-methyltransferase
VNLFTFKDASMTDDPNPFHKMQAEMIESQLAARGVTDQNVLHAIRCVPRQLFISSEFQPQAYDDNPLPIGQNQTISQPYMVGYMTQALKLEPTDRVLEIGTGSGYQTAILAELAGEVCSIEYLPALSHAAAETLYKLGYHNIHLKQGDGWWGWPEKAPFDKIIVTAAAEKMPETLLDQLKDGGLIAIPIGKADSNQTLYIGKKNGEELDILQTMAVRFVPFVHDENSDLAG